jgi:tRNA U34 5-methylaminomethyl-2-thiouridine-forming methyltransferase MnmC
MQRDRNRNEIIAPSGSNASTTISTLAERHAEMLQLPKTDGAVTLIFDEKIYQFITTDDGSPSIRLADAVQRPEAMHHSGGALSESVFIYGEALREGLKMLVAAPTVLSVGLGCGYNEWIALAEMQSRFLPQLDDFYLESFEADGPLRTEFLNFLTATPAQIEIGESLQGTFKWVLEVVAAKYDLSVEKLYKLGQQLVAEKRWVFRERLTTTTAFQKHFGVIFFDAFSTKATPDLWSEEFFTAFLENACDRPCVLATYAATGILNRSLKKAGFELAVQPGFQYKRESTRAFRKGL